MMQDKRNERKKQIVCMGMAALFLLVILLFLLFVVQGQQKKDTDLKEEIIQAEQEAETEEAMEEEPKSEVTKQVEEAFEAGLIKLHMEGYVEEIFQGWEWVLQEKLSEYAEKNSIEASDAVVLWYAGYDAGTENHAFYIQLDDADGTILFATYRPYEAMVTKTDKTAGDIRMLMEETGDAGEDEEEAGTDPEETPILPYAQMEIQDVPVSLADYLGDAAERLPSELAGFLTSVGREGDTYAVYAGNLEMENGTATFDLKLFDGVVVTVRYEKESGYFF